MKRLIKKASKMITIKEDWQDLPMSEEGKQTMKEKNYYRQLEGIININDIKDFPGNNGEIRKWWEYNGKKRFGNYTEEEWNEFLEDIKVNGIQYAILIGCYSDSSIKIIEGNHRIQAALQLEIMNVPVRIRYFGNSVYTQHYFDE